MTFLLKGFCPILNFGMMLSLKLSAFLETIYFQKYWDSQLQTHMCNERIQALLKVGCVILRLYQYCCMRQDYILTIVISVVFEFWLLCNINENIKCH